MKKFSRNIIIYTLVLMFVLIAVAPRTESFAETPPYVDDYVEVAVYVNNKKTDDIAFTIKGNVYVKVSTIEKYGDTSKLDFDTANRKVTFNVADLNLNFGDTQTTEFIKNNAGICNITIKKFPDENKKNDYFVSIGPIASIAKLAWRYSGETLYLTQYSEAGNMGKTTNLSSVASSLSNKSVATLSSGETVFVVGETKAFYKVENTAGASYYINKDELTKYDESSVINDFEYFPGPKDSFSGNINMTWYNLSETASTTSLPPEKTGGIDVLCPPWMQQTVEADGNIRQICDYGFVQLAHQLGYKVWICAQNCFSTKGSTNYTTSVMSSEKLSSKVIAQYLFYCCIYDADGLNIDYEELYNSGDKALFADFCTTIGKYCDRLGLTFSVATSEPSASGKKIYDFETLGKVCDYVVPMLYTENMAKTVGSVSSYGYYSAQINKLKELVPAEKILMGMPFFSRYYIYNSSGKITSSNNISMSISRQRISEYNCLVEWSEKDKQYIATGSTIDGKTFKIWLEDQRSVACRLEYVQESGIAGTACWAIDQQSSGILDIFESVNKYGVSPSEYFSDTY